MPLTIATPRTTAKAVRKAAELAAEEALERDADHRAAHLLHRVEDVVRGRVPEVLDDQAVGEEEDAVGDRGGVRVMGDHDGRLAVGRHRVAQQVEDLAARRRVEVARRLVGEHDGRPRDERARDRDSLLLAAGELGRPVRETLREPDLAVSSSTHSRSGFVSGQLEREDDVLLAREHRQQVEELEDEPDVLAPELRQLRVVETRDVGARDRDRALVGRSSPARMCMSVDLPEPDGPITAVSLPAADVERHAAERVHAMSPSTP